MDTRTSCSSSADDEQRLNPEAATAADCAPDSEPAQSESPEAEAEAEMTEGILEAEQAPAAPEATATESELPDLADTAELPEPADESEPTVWTKASLLEAAKELAAKEAASIQREEVSRLRQHFAAIRKAEIEQARQQWVEDGNAPADFVVADDAEEAEFIAIITEVRAKREAWAAQQEQERADNLAKKNAIIARILELAEDTDNVNRTFPEYRELQDQFNAIGRVPDTEETSVWKRFQEARERYSDNLKINKELRDYDFKKNLDAKLMLVDKALELAAEADVIAAFRRLQVLHEKWREIGPVAKELRDEIWDKFQEASTVIRKRYQAFFEERKAKEAANEAAKTALCEELEALDFSALTSFAAWDEMTAKVLDLQARWKLIGFAPRKANNALFARFRERCDQFFTAKAAYFKSVKEEQAANLARKTALAERAEALKDSTEWHKTAEELTAMQREWKTIGAVPKRHSDTLWRRFLAACDAFFERKKQATSGQRQAEADNLKAKRAIVEAIEAIVPDMEPAEAAARLRELQDQWQATGHVPFREKDKLQEAYRAAVGNVRRRLGQIERRAGMERFETSLQQMEGDKGKLMRERDRLVRACEARRNEIRTYENNIGFLNSKSATGQSLVNDFLHKIERIKADIAQIEEKIAAIDAKL